MLCYPSFFHSKTHPPSSKAINLISCACVCVFLCAKCSPIKRNPVLNWRNLFLQLVSGSSGTEQTDEKENAPEADAAKGPGDGYTEGIPGPVTRLIVLANRGLSNLIQDLILVSVNHLVSLGHTRCIGLFWLLAHR